MTIDRARNDVVILLAPHDPLATGGDAHLQPAPTTAESAALVRARASLDSFIRTDSDPRPRPTPVPHRAGRPRWAVLAAPAGAVAAAAVVAVLLVGGSTSTPDRTDPPSTALPVEAVPVASGDPAAAPGFLGELATTVAAATVPIPRADQFVYVRSTTASIDLTPTYEGTGPAVDEGMLDREIWLSQDPEGGSGLIREDGLDTPLNPELGGGASPSRYAALAALPTDPVLLLAQLTATAVEADTDPSFAAFTTIRDLLAESLAPPTTTAALYRAAALIPGIELVPDAVDAADRIGTGIALVRDDQRTELVFDATSGTYLGDRSYYQTDGRWGPAGTLTSLSAVLARGVSDTAGTVPAGADLVD